MTNQIHPPIRPRTRQDALQILEAFKEWLAKQYEAQDQEIEEWVAYSSAITKAHGMTYTPNGPEDPGPEPCAFDIWAVEELRKQRDFAVAVLRECEARWDKQDEADAPLLGARIRLAARMIPAEESAR